MNNTAAWVVVRTVSTGLEADVAQQSLEAEGIPLLVRGNRSGIFGAAFQGSVVGGIELLVPNVELERAREVLG